VLLEAFDAADLATAKDLLMSRSAERATAGVATAAAGRATEAASRTTEAAGRTTEAAGRTTEAAGRTTEAAGRTTEAARDLLVGVNCRDLATLEVVQERFEALAPQLPGDWPAVAESGVATAADARRMRRLGYRLALIGTALMGCDEPAKLLGEILAATRTLES
jgi:pyridoxal biosynthesis lyase PdxS